MENLWSAAIQKIYALLSQIANAETDNFKHMASFSLSTYIIGSITVL